MSIVPTLAPAVDVSSVPREQASRTPRLSIVIVNYRQWDETEDLVRHLQAAASLKRGDAEIVVVDNHSPIHPVIKRLRRQPNVSLRRWRQNGFRGPTGMS